VKILPEKREIHIKIAQTEFRLRKYGKSLPMNAFSDQMILKNPKYAHQYEIIIKTRCPWFS